MHWIILVLVLAAGCSRELPPDPRSQGAKIVNNIELPGPSVKAEVVVVEGQPSHDVYYYDNDGKGTTTIFADWACDGQLDMVSPSLSNSEGVYILLNPPVDEGRIYDRPFVSAESKRGQAWLKRFDEIRKSVPPPCKPADPTARPDRSFEAERTIALV